MVAAPRYEYRSAVVGDLDPDDAARVMGTYLTCRGIHLPSDPSTWTLSRNEREAWNAARDAAMSHYGKKDLAEKTAWKAHRLFFHNGQMRPALPRGRTVVSAVTDPGNLVRFGVILEYSYIDADANLQHLRFKGEPPSFYWSDTTKSIIVVPGTDSGHCMRPMPNAPETVMYKRWTQRDATCVREVKIPDVQLQLVGNVDTFVYRSDKWHEQNIDDKMVGSQEYIHQFGDGVGLWVAPSSQSRRMMNPAARAPRLLVITGGCLDAEERGIIH